MFSFYKEKERRLIVINNYDVTRRNEIKKNKECHLGVLII